MPPNYMSMSGYGQPMAPFALTQPEPIPSWMPVPVASAPRSFPMASAMPSVEGMGHGAWLGDYGDMAPALPSVNTPGGGWNWLSTRDKQGVLGPVMAGAQALGSLYMGMKQYGLAKDTLAANKAQFERNFDAQRRTTNAALEDRQRARVASNPGAYQSVGDYMNQNEVR